MLYKFVANSLIVSGVLTDAEHDSTRYLQLVQVGVSVTAEGHKGDQVDKSHY